MFGREDFEFDMKTEENEIPGVQPENPAQSEHFGDFIVKYMQNVENTMELFPGTTFQAVNEIFGILYVPLENTGELEITGTSYNSIPKCYTYMDMEAAGASGITRLHDHPYLKLRGKGTAVAVIDSGIDYQNEVFRNAGGSRIAYLWDQSLEEESGTGFRESVFHRAVPGYQRPRYGAGRHCCRKYGSGRKFHRSSARGNPYHYKSKTSQTISAKLLSLSSGGGSFSGR